MCYNRFIKGQNFGNFSQFNIHKQKIHQLLDLIICFLRPTGVQNEGLFPVLTWRQYSMERSWRYWNCLSQTFFHSAQGLSIPKWCFLGNIFPIDTWRTSKMRDHLEITIVWRSHLFQHEIVICKSAKLFSDIHPSYIEVVICHSNLLEFVWNMAYTYMIVVKTLSKNKHR